MATIDSTDGTYILKAVCQYVNQNHPEFPDIQIGDILSSRIQDDFILVLADCGIKGIPRFIVSIDDLRFPPEPEVEVIDVTEPISEPEVEVTEPMPKPEPEVIAKAGETAIEALKKSPIEIEYVDLEEKKPKPKTKQQAVNGRRKRGKK